MDIKPEDLVEITEMLDDFKQYLPIIKSILEENLPELIDALSPLAKEFIEGSARMKRRYYETLIEQGFNETQAFDLLLDWETRMERIARQTSNSASAIKINTEGKKGGLRSLFSSN